ncbi:cobalamin synthesis protein [Streptomyces zinciresistens K42]|uniref:Cobalamin synthesis protein n=1 Tax=Streptomyces zinciresistens K42 TaxID=700597 RepID=G2G5I7_9ACTN|nr:cobalamin synthesis protein [Streptomyces zinciresistens K42]
MEDQRSAIKCWLRLGLRQATHSVFESRCAAKPARVGAEKVEVVDAAEFDDTRARHPEIDRHLALADLVVVNKLDRTDAGERVLGLVRQLAGSAAVVPARYGRIDPGLLFDRRPAAERVGQLSFDDLRAPDGTGRSDAHGEHPHARYDSLSFTSEVPLDPRRLMAFLDTRPEGLYRIKGHVGFGAHDVRNRYGVHAVGRFLRFTPEPWPRGEAPVTRLVLIGSGIDAATLRKELEACRSDAPHTADEHGMWGVLRYVRDPEEEPREEEPREKASPDPRA